jgi:tetratricopeptide (TPR) repeat protein
MNRLCVASFLFVFLLVSPKQTLAQRGGPGESRAFSVTGIVFNENSKRPVLQARIILSDAGGNLIEEMTTDDSGQFNFRQIKPSNYILTVSAPGLQPETVHLDLSVMSEKGLSIYLKTVDAPKSAPASSISAHELSIPQGARDLLAAGQKKLYVDKDANAGLLALQQAVAKAPNFYEAYYEMGVAYLTLGRREEAEKGFRKSIEISNDKYADPVIGLGTMLLDANDPQNEKMIRHGLEINPNAWLGHYELGRSLFMQNRIAESEKSADQERSLAPNAPVVYRLLSNIHLREKNYPALLQDLDAYIQLDPASPAGIRAKELRTEIQKKVDATTPASDRPVSVGKPNP